MAVMIAVHGPSGRGKTTLIEKVLSRLVARGLKVGVIKHAHKGFSLDPQGKDSQRFWEAGATAVVAAGPEELFVRHRRTWSRASELRNLLPRELDCMFIEGFSHSTDAMDEAITVRVEIVQKGVKLNGHVLPGDQASAAVEEAVIGCLNRERTAVTRQGRDGCY